MTWQLKIRTAPGALIATEYDCPVHGRFAIDVPRDESGDPPMNMPCPAIGWGYSEGCMEPSRFVISAPARCKVRLVEAAIRGKDQKAELPTWTDMTNLMEGQDVDEWREERERKVWDEERYKMRKEILNG